MINAAVRRLLPMAAPLLFVAGVLGQKAPATVQDATTARVAGLVIDQATKRPVAQAMVMIAGIDVGVTRATNTDAQGRFAFQGVPPGHVLLAASKAAYLPVSLDAAPGRPGRILTITAGQRLADVTIAIVKGAAVSGRVLDANGEPIADARVRLLPRRTVGDEISIGQDAGEPANAVTDDHGVYRLFAVPPGEYMILAQPRRPPPPGTVPPPQNGQVISYGPAFLGASTVDDAKPLTLASGDDRSGVDLRSSVITLARIDGVVAMPSSVGGVAPRGVQVTLRPRGQRIAGGTPGGFTTTSGAEGRFTIANVPPGQYSVLARTQPPPAAPQNDAPQRQAGGFGQIGTWSAEDITVTNANVTDLQLVLRPAVMVSGRVMVDGLDRLPDEIPAIRVGVRPTLATGQPNAIETVPIGKDGRFQILGLWPGRFRLFLQIPGNVATQVPDWFPVSALVDGQDALDTPFEVGTDGRLVTAAITLTDDVPEVAGTVTDAAGKPMADCPVLLFSVDRKYWFPQSRRVAARQTGGDGLYVFGLAAGLPAGEYYLAATPNARTGDQFDPWVFEELVPTATRVTLGPHDSKTVDLRVKR